MTAICARIHPAAKASAFALRTLLAWTALSLCPAALSPALAAEVSAASPSENPAAASPKSQAAHEEEAEGEVIGHFEDAASQSAAQDTSDTSEKRDHTMAFPPCPPLPTVPSGGRPFIPGEHLSFDVDLTGAAAGTMTLSLQGIHKGRQLGSGTTQDVRLTAHSGTLAAKIKDASAAMMTTLDAQMLVPLLSREDIALNGRHFSAAVSFGVPVTAPSPAAASMRGPRPMRSRREAASPAPSAPEKSDNAEEKSENPQSAVRTVSVDWKNAPDKLTGTDTWQVSGGALDFLSAFYFFRSLSLKPGDEFCADVMVVRKLWRLTGTVVGHEHASTPAGEFEVLHLAGKAALHDKPDQFREVHYWISDDKYRLPVAVMGVVRMGTLRAILSSVRRSDLNLTPARPSSMEW